MKIFQKYETIERPHAVEKSPPYHISNMKKLFWEEKMLYAEKIAFWLIVIGGINWGAIGLLDFNIVGAVFGGASLISRIIYIIVGLSALWLVYAQLIPEKNKTDTK